MNEIPEPWASAMVESGFVDGRVRTGPARPSTRSLASASGVHATTIARMIAGEVETDHQNVVRVAKALRLSPVTVSQWVGQARTERAPWEPPASVHQLTRREQSALSELINAMAAAREEVVGNAEHPAPTSTAGATPVEEPMSDPDGYVLAARDVDDDEESEAQQEQP